MNIEVYLTNDLRSLFRDRHCLYLEQSDTEKLQTLKSLLERNCKKTLTVNNSESIIDSIVDYNLLYSLPEKSSLRWSFDLEDINTLTYENYKALFYCTKDEWNTAIELMNNVKKDGITFRIRLNMKIHNQGRDHLSNLLPECMKEFTKVRENSSEGEIFISYKCYMDVFHDFCFYSEPAGYENYLSYERLNENFINFLHWDSKNKYNIEKNKNTGC